MNLFHVTKKLNGILSPLDLAVVRRSHFQEMFGNPVEKYKGWCHRGHVSAEALEYLRHDNPLLQDYKKRYAGHPATRHSIWEPRYLQEDLSLGSFRDDNVYLWQSRRAGQDLLVAYAFTTYYIKDIDTLRLLDKLDEDGSFGALTFTVDHGKIVSRDLLDSVLEMSFLERHLQLSRWPSIRVLDIGAGYGRLAHRLVEGLPNIQYVLCADAVPESSFLCQYYLGYRNVSDRAKTIPLDMVEPSLDDQAIDLVTNIHSFQECTIESIAWWCKAISRSKVKYFMLAHYDDELLSRELDRSQINFHPLLERYGFHLTAKEPVYAPGTLAGLYGLYPKRWHYLFESNVRTEC
ncbi:MAG TPA: putative sugar O-methyltransferase [Nitrospira sp.]|nr:putative sugar O-methyltransferase [Nitrospira sp.]